MEKLIKSNLIIYLFLITKVLLSSIIAFDVLTKCDAGFFVNLAGNFVCGGNTLLGTFFIYVIAISYLLFCFILRLFVENTFLKFFVASIILDVLLTFINLKVGIHIGILNQMPLEDAMCKYTILSAGTAVVYVFLTVLVLILYLCLYKRECSK